MVGGLWESRRDRCSTSVGDLDERGGPGSVSLTLTTIASEPLVFEPSQGILSIYSGERRRYVSKVKFQSSSAHDTPGNSMTVVDLAVLERIVLRYRD